MTIDLSKISSDELFELAKQKRQQEEDVLKRGEVIAALEARRAQLIQENRETIKAIDTKVAELQQHRAQLVIKHKEGLDKLDKALGELRGQAMAEEVSIASDGPTSDASGDIYSHLTELMKGRPYVSESMLKEHLRSRGVDTSKLHKQLEQLVKEGRLTHQGSGNYALGKRR